MTMQEAVGDLTLKGHALVEAFERERGSDADPADHHLRLSRWRFRRCRKTSESDPAFVDRFEIYAAGMEIGNAYTELNDPQEQRRRLDAVRDAGSGDEEAHQMDEDYLRAMFYGMPPAGGEKSAWTADDDV